MKYTEYSAERYQHLRCIQAVDASHQLWGRGGLPTDVQMARNTVIVISTCPVHRRWRVVTANYRLLPNIVVNCIYRHKTP